MSRSSIKSFRPSSLCALLVVAVFSSGCDPKPGSISGKIVFYQKPLPGGRITLVDPQGKAYAAEISEAGEYSIKDVPVGAYQVGVRNDMLRMAASLPAPPVGAAPEVKGKYIPIPEKFFDATKSGLTVTIASGAQTKDIDLK